MASSEVNLDQLSQSQQEALQQYTSVTDQNVQEAIPLLQRSQWNVQIAIAKFFDGEQPDPVAEAIAAQNTSSARAPRQENLQESLLRGSSPFAHASTLPNRLDAAPRIVPQPEDQIIRRPPFLLALFLSPFHLLYKILSSTLGIFGYLFPFLPRLLQPRVSSRSSRMRNTTGRRMLNPRDSAARFKREFEEEYGPNTLPFFDNGYAQALDLTKKELKFLLVILLSPEHDDTSSFTRDTLLSPEFIAFINDPANNFVLWAGNVQDSEAYQVSTALRTTKFPFAALIAHTPQNGPTAMSVIEKLAGPMPASTYVAKLQSAVSINSGPLAEARSARAAQDFERSLRQEQDSAYERSLAQDRERVRQRREAEAAQAADEARAAEEAVASQKYAVNLKQWKQWRAGHIAPEPAADTKDSVRIGLRMPESAERITRKFRGDLSIEELYAFVECSEVLAEGIPLTSVEPPAAFHHKYGFRLVSPMPRVVYDIDEGGTIGERVGRSANLIVEPIFDDEDGEA